MVKKCIKPTSFQNNSNGDRMNLRTDLAIDKKTVEKGIEKEEKSDGITLYKDLKGKEKHITISFPQPDLMANSETLEKEIENSLNFLMPEVLENVMVVGLGNTEITADSIGPITASSLLATRHIKGEFSEKIGLKNLKSVSVISPNVLGKTGIEAAEIVKSITDSIKPQAVIVIDALASSDVARLFRTVQFTNCGISPGSGVKNSRKELSFKTLGVPTIAIGIPTVVDIGNKNDGAQMIVTPKDADIYVKKLSEILSRSLNFFLQPDIDREIIASLV